MSAQICYLDFEFNSVSEKFVNLVSCVTLCGDGQLKKWWLHNNPASQKLLDDYLKTKDLLMSYAAVAECRSLLSLGIDPRSFKHIDLFFEYRCLTNHNDRLNWGPQLVDGVVKQTKKPKPKWERTEDDKRTGFRPTHSLAEATYKLLGQIRDTEHKNQMRDLIISAPAKFTLKEQKDILKYNADDVLLLPDLWNAMQTEYKRLIPDLDLETLKHEALIRGRYAAHTAMMESRGYPINVEATKNFSSQVLNILFECQREINRLFPDIKPFKWSKKDGRFSWDQKKTREWVKSTPHFDDWERTDTDQISLSLDAFQRFFDFKHDYPTDNFGAQMVRYLKLKQSLNGFVPSPDKSKKTFWSFVGSDGRVRAYLNPYGAQSSRTQPGATGFLFLKPAWMRALCQPDKGKFMAGIDYGSQEFFIQALAAEDYAMIEAYLSGDPYLYFGIQSGMIPEGGTKQTHNLEREAAKSTTLGISFLMSKYGLAIKLSSDTGVEYTEDDAQELIDLFYETYPDLKIYQDEVVELYQEQGYLKLKCGWYIFGDNENFRSVTNVPTQGCLHGDTRILTRQFGFQKISDLVGILDLDVWDGKKFIKADCLFAGEKELVEIDLNNGQTLRCSPDHQFRVVNNIGVEGWKTPGEFKSQTFLRFTDNSDAFDSQVRLTEDNHKAVPNTKLYSLNSALECKFKLGVALGRLASDGFFAPRKGMLWTVAEHELSILPELLEAISTFAPDYKISTRRRISREQSLTAIKVYSRSLEKQFEELDIKKSLTHPFIWHSKELLRGFLRGYFDGDGCVRGHGSRGTVSVTFGKGERKARYAAEIQKALTVFGIQSRLHVLPGRTNLMVTAAYRRVFETEIGFLNPLKNKKLAALPDSTRSRNVMGRVERVKSVRHTEIKIPMYDIANCPEKKFCADGFVTHNTGAAIMRRAVDMAEGLGVEVIKTLHDAIYIEGDVGNENDIKILRDCMRDAFVEFFPDHLKQYAEKIRLDPFAWSPDYKPDSEIMIGDWTIDASNLYIDGRARREYDAFSKYFKQSDLDLL